MNPNIANKNFTVAGMGQTGLALADLLRAHGAKPFLSDSRPDHDMATASARLRQLNVPYETGGHTQEALEHANALILSPGVPPAIPLARQAREQGIPVMGEMEFAFPFCKSKILAVTGTNGKTTTTELLKTLVTSCGHSVLLAGNNDAPFSTAVMAPSPPEYIVLEVSSYQLETAQAFRPWIGAVLNVTPDHLARHGDMENYAFTKQRIFAAQRQGDKAVLNADAPYTADMGVPDDVELWAFSLVKDPYGGLWLDGNVIREGTKSLANLSDIRIPGRHNIENVLAALTIMRAGGFDWEKTVQGLRTFKGVEHRIEFVASHNGISYYNDSKATNIDSLRVALESFEAPIVLIAGGEGKGSDYTVLTGLVKHKVKKLVAFGQDAPLLTDAFGEVVPVEQAGPMDEVVSLAAQSAAPGDIVLLSPACASFDMFDNFEQRGKAFKEAVRDYLSRCGEDPAS